MSEWEDLWPQQIEALPVLTAHTRFLLGDDPGLGKSRSAITACDLIRAESILILCPAIARFNWENEFQKFSPFGHTFSLVLSETGLRSMESGVICSYDLAIQNSVSTTLLSRNWDCLILDEVHKLNSRTSQRTRLVYGRLGHQCRYVWGLSGTPSKKHAGDLWCWLSFTGTYAGDYWEFVFEFLETRQTPYALEIVGTKPHMVEPLRQLLAKTMLRRERKHYMKHLPALTFEDYIVEAAPVDIRRWYSEVLLDGRKHDRVQDEIANEIRSMESVMSLVGGSDAAGVEVLTGLSKKSEKSRKYIGLQKAPSVAAIINQELTDKDYEKIVIFAWHRDVVECLRLLLKPWHPEVLYGGTLISKRNSILKRFKTDKKFQVVICSVAISEAIELTAASEVAFVEPSYLPGDNAQAILRVHRHPQEKPVRVRFFSLYKHVDLQIGKILRRRAADLVALFDTSAESPATPTPEPGVVLPTGLINPFE